jgi:penicillin-binding protein 2
LGWREEGDKNRVRKRRNLGASNLLNASFGHTVTWGRGNPRDFFPQARSTNRWMFLVCALLIFLFFGFGRLVDLQIISGGYYRQLADGNRIRRIPIKAPRGEILDRTGKSLARNTPVYKLATFTDSGVVKETQEIHRDQALSIQASDTEEANRLLVEVAREYPLGPAGAHLIGYVNEVGEKEIGRQADCANSGFDTQYMLGDLKGRAGVEQQYECELRGVNGEELIEVDARGKLVRRLGRRDPIPGRNIQLTIDGDLQNVAYNALLDAPNEKGTAPFRESGGVVQGGLVVENPQNGEILVLASVPSFDPATLRDNYASLVQDKSLPFFNRAIGGSYHPGSTFKIVTSTAGLEAGKIDANFRYTDTGFIQIGQSTFRNWYYGRYGRGEGEMDLTRAIARSTDTFFYKVGEMVGVEGLAEWSTAYNLGRPTGVDLPGEAAGLVPTPEWKERVLGERWYLGNTYNFSIGQGDLTATPLQINTVASVIASEGKWCKPHVLQTDEAKWKKDNCRDMGLKSETLHLVKAGMLGACSPGGTAGQFFTYHPEGTPANARVACKTGTAEVGNDRTHAWFTSFGPIMPESGDIMPQISATVVIEQGGEGSTVAAPVIKKIYEAYFKAK